jgi:CRISPR-associated protein Csd1
VIITALARYRPPDVVPFGYAAKRLGYTLVLSEDGRQARLDAHHDERGKAPDAIVPNIARTVKATPLLGCDNAAYVLGITKEGEPAAKAAVKHRLFADLVRALHTRAPDPIAAAYLAWDERGRPGLDEALAKLSGKSGQRLHMDLISLAVDGQAGRLHESPAAQSFWAEVARDGKAGGDSAICLSCGHMRPTVSTLPQSLIGHLVPGATQANVALASVNFGSASRGASGTGLRSAPICADCAAQAVQSFNSLASTRESSWRSPTNDYGMQWWATDAGTADLAGRVFRPEPGVIRDLLAWIRKGRDHTQVSQDHGVFYLLAYSGNVARFVVRQWLEIPATDMRAALAAWFADCETPSSENPYSSVDAYAACLGVLRRDQGKWLEPPPHGSVEALVRTALTELPVPHHYLALALNRAAAEVRLMRSDDGLTAHIARRRMNARVGLLRLILNRYHPQENAMPVHLDESRDDPAYVAGRLFAVRELLQAWALGDVNASIVDKYFERASQNPASVAQSLEVLTKQHIAAIKRKSGTGAKVSAEERITEINALQGDAPGRLTPEQQAAWLCGYHQQRLHDIGIRRARSAAKAAGDPASLATTETDPDH